MILTGPWGPVPSTANMGPPELVPDTERGLVIPSAAPVLCLLLLICGEEQFARGQGSRGSNWHVWKNMVVSAARVHPWSQAGHSTYPSMPKWLPVIYGQVTLYVLVECMMGL